jgi:hypothetical protein
MKLRLPSNYEIFHKVGFQEISSFLPGTKYLRLNINLFELIQGDLHHYISSLLVFLVWTIEVVLVILLSQ